MRPASWIAAAAFCAASPAVATGAITCQSTISPGDGPTLTLGVGHGEASGVFSASFSYGNVNLVTGGNGGPRIGQAWIDEFALRVDLVDSNVETRLVRLDTRRRRGSDYLGILIHNGRTWRVRCSESG